jgi:thiamine biosynthesis lipoprotein
MVMGVDAGADLARRARLDALFLVRDDAGGVQSIGVGKLFSNKTKATAPAVGG